MKKIFQILVILFAICNLTFLAVPTFALAQTNPPPPPPDSSDTCDSGSISAGVKCLGQAAYGQEEPASLTAIVVKIVNALLTILGLVFLILIIYGGFTWMTSMGQEDKIKKAKATLTQAVIGLIIVIAAYSIANFIFILLNNNVTPGGAGGIFGGGS